MCPPWGSSSCVEEEERSWAGTYTHGDGESGGATVAGGGF